MAIKTTQNQSDGILAHKGIISSALALWGLSAIISGIATAYTNAAVVIANQKAAAYLLAPYALNVFGGAFNLLFGITLIAIGMKIKKL